MNKGFIIGFCLCLLLGKGVSQEKLPQKLFAWFDSLNQFPKEYMEHRFVKVPTKQGGSPYSYTWGFLLEDKRTKFTLYTLGLRKIDFLKKTPKTSFRKKDFYEEMDLSKGVKDFLDWARGQRVGYGNYNARFLGRDTMAFILARVCFYHNRYDLARELSLYACSIPSDEGKKDSLAKKLMDDIGYDFMWATVLGHAYQSRPQLILDFEYIVKKFPLSRYVVQAKKSIEILHRMAQEDEDYKKEISNERADEITIKEKIADLIFQLRDQTGQQYIQPGFCNIFLGSETPAHQLFEIGYQAVPQLIDALEDDRFTRAIEFHRDFYFSHYPLRIRDCALLILKGISGRSFYLKNYWKYTKDKKNQIIKKKIETWWKNFQARGEKQVLIEGVLEGNDSSWTQAKYLLQRYPEEALPTLIQGFKNSKSRVQRQEILGLIAQLEGPEVIDFLWEKLRFGEYFYIRIEAAKILRSKGEYQVTSYVINMWGTFLKTNYNRNSFFSYSFSKGKQNQEKSSSNYSSVSRKNAREILLSYLTTCGDLKAIFVLERTRPILDRYTKLSILLLFEKFLEKQARGNQFLDHRITKAIEKLLISATKDTQELIYEAHTPEGDFYQPRACDMAAYILSRNWPEKYYFEITSSLQKRDLLLVECQNTWYEEMLKSLSLQKKD